MIANQLSATYSSNPDVWMEAQDQFFAWNWWPSMEDLVNFPGPAMELIKRLMVTPAFGKHKKKNSRNWRNSQKTENECSVIDKPGHWEFVPLLYPSENQFGNPQSFSKRLALLHSNASPTIWQAILRAKLGNTLEGAVLLSQMGSILYQMALYSQVNAGAEVSALGCGFKRDWCSWFNKIPGRDFGCLLWIHPWRLTWNIIMEVWKIIFLSKWVIWRFHVNLPGCSFWQINTVLM